MALFTDGNISSAEDLAAHDAGVTALAAVEGIDLTQKATLAQDELGIELAALLPRADPFDAQFSAVRTTGLDKVVVTAPLRLWHAFHTLELVYRDAYNNQLNDRYKGKWEEYARLSRWAAARLLETGVGMAADPVARGEAPEMLEAEGTLAESTTYYASVAWVNSRGEEGAASPWELLTVSANAGLAVRPRRAPANAAGWNVYVGEAAESMTRQNAAPLGVAETWHQPAAPADGPAPGDGQRPSYLRALPRVLQRG